MRIPKIASSKVHRYLSDPKFKKEFDRDYRVDRSYDVPYVAGYSEDAKTVFIDRHFKKMMGSVDVEPYVFVHEKAEKALIDTFGLKYQEAHHIATCLERLTIDRDGIDWHRYEKFVMDQYKHIGHEKIERVPPNLDITPYKDEHDIKLLRDLRDGVTRDDKKSERGRRRPSTAS